MMDIYTQVQKLVRFGLYHQLLKEEDEIFARNQILRELRLSNWIEHEIEEDIPDWADSILEPILDWAYETELLSSPSVTERDILESKLMNCLMPRPSEIIYDFYQKMSTDPRLATEMFYRLNIASNYIQMKRLSKNMHWRIQSPFGSIEITINLSKPEKDPKEIEKMKELPKTSYPICLLCAENEGFEGSMIHPARSNHRIVPVQLNDEKFFLQYSPYVYYDEHSVILHSEHIPMQISEKTFIRLLDFVEQFPHYFIGSNADLPIVGGSILAHEHYQGGSHTFSIQAAEWDHVIQLSQYPSITMGIIKWPMSVIRVRGSKEEVLAVVNMIYRSWKEYSDPSVDIFSASDGVCHNTVTPIARKNGEFFEMDVVLRNNRTSEEHPYGIFHPHQELHHIKKENIGLIEVMGLAVLPGRLAAELEQLAQYLLNPVDVAEWDASIVKHRAWYGEILDKYPSITIENARRILEQEVGYKFVQVLEHAGVYKRNVLGQQRFIAFVNRIQELCAKNAL